MKTLKAAMQMNVTDVSLKWNLASPPEVQVVPKPIPPVYSGDRLILYAVMKEEVCTTFFPDVSSAIPHLKYSLSSFYCHWPEPLQNEPIKIQLCD